MLVKTLFLLLSTLSCATSAFAGQPPVQDKKERVTARIEAYVNSIKTIKSGFYQVTQSGASAQGRFYAMKPNKMRLDYDPPTPIELVEDGYYLIFHDKKLEQVTYLNPDENPAAMLLKENFSFEKDGLLVENVKEADGLISVTVSKKEAPQMGKITLIFKDRPLALKQWQVVDAQQNITLVTLTDTEFDVPLEAKLFKFKDPYKKRPGD